MTLSEFVSAPSSPRLRQFAIALTCLAVVTAGAFLRLVGTNWDDGANLHPDERHMMFVVMDTLEAFKTPQAATLSTAEMWFGTGVSPLDPRRQDRLYVYGELPHLVVSLVARATGQNGWPDIQITARTIGSALDAYTVLAVFLLAALGLRSAGAGLGAAALYAFAPVAIQQANFFAVDSWLAAAIAWCLVATVMLVRATSHRAALGWSAAAGVLAGLAFACKLPGLAAFGAVVVAIAMRWWQQGRLGQTLLALATALIAGFVTFRLACPFTFQGPGLFGLAVTPKVIEGYAAMTRLVLDFGFPPAWQWLTGYGPLDALSDAAGWALGPVFTLFVSLGAVGLATRRRAAALVPALATGAVLLLYWLANPTPALRYMLPAVPVLAAVGGAAVPLLARLPAGRLVAVLLLGVAGWWGLGIPLLHSSTHNRLAASRWLWLNTAPGTAVVNESAWDDGLPVPVRLQPGPNLAWPGLDDHFRFERLNLEHPDSANKAAAMADTLARADLLVISSERMRRPILELPGRFPLSGAYYRMLADGSLCFEPVFTRQTRYRLPGLSLDDSGVQEPWSVYDHPAVEIYRKLPCYDAAEVRRRLLASLPPSP